MSSTRPVVACGLLTLVLLAAGSKAQTGGQSGSRFPATDSTKDTTATKDPQAARPPDTTKKKSGWLSKMNKVAHNEYVKDAAKTAACMTVPGGQYVAAGIDAATADNVGDAAKKAAAGAAGASCNGPQDALSHAMSHGAEAKQAQAQAQQQQMVAQQQQILQNAANNPNADPGSKQLANTMLSASNDSSQAACLGLSLEDYKAWHEPTNGEIRQPTKDEQKRQMAVGKKIDPHKQAQCNQQYSQQMMAGAQQSMASAQDKMASAPASGMSEAPGKSVEMSMAPAVALKQGHTAVKSIDWVVASANVSASGQASFDDAMAKLAKAIKETGDHYRLDIYMDTRYDDGAVKNFGPQRLSLIQTALVKNGVAGDAVTVGTSKKDSDPRLEIVRTGK
ncbi:MAG TPA: hypothetical protein VEI06_12745 [Gemmatimonadaceae bacterium]|nr:hypothetical protein [Gemmatimonadaceae bacterium]